MRIIGSFAWLPLLLGLLTTPAAAATLTFTITANEPVMVSGTPRIALDVGGITRYATFSGSASTPSTSLPFSYAVQAGDFDADGINVATPLDLNGATLTDVAGNPLTAPAFTTPDTSALKVQTYTTSFTSTSDLSAASFTIAKAPAGASFSYSISSSSGPATIDGSGTIGSSSHVVSGIDVRALPGGTLTLSVTVSNASGTGAARTASFTPSSAYVLDDLPSAAAAYSVRRLRAAYTGPLLRVARTSDGAAMNIGFTIGGDLDQAALTSHCGAGTCTVSIWYDQSGNGWNAFNNNTSVRPRIINAGAVELLGSRPAVRFFGGQRLDATSFPAIADEFTISLVAVERVRGNSNIWVLSSTPTVLAHMPWGDGALDYVITTRISTTWPVATDTPAVANFRNSASAGTQSVFLNGGQILSGTGLAAPASRFSIGSNYNGAIPEVVLFTSSINDTSRLALERSQGSYYGVTVQ